MNDFIKKMENKGYIREDTEFFITMVALYEKDSGKPIGQFDLDTVNTMLSILAPKGKIEVERLVMLLEEYLKYTKQDVSFDLNNLQILYSDYLVQKDVIPTEASILEDIGKLESPLDRIILAAPYYGIGGTGMNELLELRGRDINYYKKQVSVYKKKIDPIKKIVIDLPEQLIKWMKEAIDCEEDNGIVFMKNDFLIKRRVTSKRDDRKKNIDERLININKRLESNYTFTTLRKFGIINSFKQATEEYKVNLETLLSTDVGQKIMIQYSYPAQRKTILIKKYKQYVD